MGFSMANSACYSSFFVKVVIDRKTFAFGLKKCSFFNIKADNLQIDQNISILV